MEATWEASGGGMRRIRLCGRATPLQRLCYCSRLPLGSMFPLGSVTHVLISDFKLLSPNLSPCKLPPRVHDGPLVIFTICYSFVVRPLLLWSSLTRFFWKPSILLFHFSSHLSMGLAYTSSCCLQHHWLSFHSYVTAAPIVFYQNHPTVCLWSYHCHRLQKSV